MSLEPGQRLGPYRIDALLGAGGMGEVYRAVDTRLDRQVAIKVLPEALSRDDRLRRRLEREARTLSQLQHPHVCMLLDVGDGAQGRFYLVMEHLEGETLETRLRRGPLAPAEALRVGREIADGIDAAHRRGVVHRDLKPGNVMLTAHGAKVLDFGIAKGLDAAVVDSTTQSPTLTRPLTEDGVLAGTFPYMAPEQLEGKPADVRSDLWALGCVLYEMVVGERPFRGSTQASLIGAIMQSQPAPVSQRRPLLPDRLDWVVSRCLEKDPERRWQSARDVAIELDAMEHATGAPESSPTTSIPRSAPPVGPSAQGEPRPRVAASLAGVTLAVIAVAGVVGWIASRAPLDHESDAEVAAPASPVTAADRPIIVVMPFENLGPAAHAYFAAGVSEEIRAKLATLAGLGVISRNSARHSAEAGKTIRQMGEELGVDYVLDGTVRWAGDRVRIQPLLTRVSSDTQIWEETLDHELSVENLLAVQSEIAARVARQIDESLLQTAAAAPASMTASIEAYQAYLRGIALKEHYVSAKLEQAGEMFARATEIDPGFALAWANLAEVHSVLYHQGDQGAARRAKAERAVERASALAPDLPETHRARGHYFDYVTRQLEPALRELELAAAGLPNDGEVLGVMSFIQFQQGDFERGLAVADRAQRLDPTSTTALYQAGWPRMYLRRYEAADDIFARIIAMDREHLAARWTRAWNTAQWKGYEAAAALTSEKALPRWRIELARMRGRWDEALALTDDLPREGEVWTNYTIPKDLHRAWVHRDRGNAALAREHFESARLTLEQLLKERPLDDRVHSALGHAYAGLGRKEEAIAHGRRGFELKPPSQTAANGVFRLQDLAMIHAQIGEHEQALDCLEDLLGRPAPFSVRNMEADPAFASLREHPRYRALLQRYR